MDTEQRGYLKEMKKSVERMVRLLAALLNASRMDSGNLQPELKDTDMHALMREVQEDIEVSAHEAGIKLKTHLPKSAVRLKTDQTLLRIVLQNLIGNAIKYSKYASGSEVNIEMASDKKSITITISDQGLGIPRAEQQRIFQKFFRATNVRKVDTDGNGLGLYISKTIVDRLGGTISFTSQENKGSVFTVTFKTSNTKKAA
jgi:signal transduction histidine kinase